MRAHIITTFITMLLLAIIVSAQATDERRFINPAQISRTGRAASDFVPPGWKIEQRIEGDFNTDGRTDTVLALIEDLPEEAAPGTPRDRHRALLVLLKEPKSTLRRIGIGISVLRCTTCNGMFGSGGGDISITDKGVLTIKQIYGSREAVDYTLRFRYNTTRGHMVLIGEDVILTDSATGKSTTTSNNYLTGIRVTHHSQYNKHRERDVVLSTKRTRIKRRTLTLEENNFERY